MISRSYEATAWAALTSGIVLKLGDNGSAFDPKFRYFVTPTRWNDFDPDEPFTSSDGTWRYEPVEDNSSKDNRFLSQPDESGSNEKPESNLRRRSRSDRRERSIREPKGGWQIVNTKLETPVPLPGKWSRERPQLLAFSPEGQHLLVYFGGDQQASLFTLPSPAALGHASGAAELNRKESLER